VASLWSVLTVVSCRFGEFEVDFWGVGVNFIQEKPARQRQYESLGVGEIDRFQSIGTNKFGVEDLAGGGDKDYHESGG
jgi:hypothetical protein